MLLRNLVISLLMLATLPSMALANSNFNLGVRFLGAGWQGDNSNGGNFESDKGGQFGVSLSYQNNRFYTGISARGGNYQFDNEAPSQLTNSGLVAVSNDEVEQNEIDILFGYYFWDQISLFIDLKAMGNKWKSNGYQQGFGGLGFGASGYAPINQEWTLFGSIGFVPSAEVIDTNENKLADGNSSSFEVGGIYKIDENNNISVGLKFRNYNYESGSSSIQDYEVNSIFFGYNHIFNIQ